MNEATTPEAGPIRFFGDDHRVCDGLWADVETAAESRDAARAGGAWTAFEQRFRRHIAMEEEVLFPAFEAATGMTSGPTAVMRMEHQQMRAQLDRMAALAAGDDWNGLLDQGDTLLMLIQQHNMKEEGMLYPMSEAHLRSQWPGLAARLARY